ncbi:MAG: NADH-quinone oxidoreductase subunit NuoF [Gaiellaceae bacterium]
MPEKRLLLAHADERDLTKLAEYRATGGYESLAKARQMEPQQVIDELLAANLRGRGGAFFPMGRKASFLAPGPPRYLVVNADESEPGTFKDREILFSDPHRLVEGCLITAHAIGCTQVFIYIRGEYLAEFEILKAAADEARDAGLFDGVTIVMHRGAGAYICGEESALLESLEGKRGQPRARPPFPAVSGLYKAPTLINNVETVSTVPVVLELGGAEFAKLGVPPDSTGTRVFSLSGNVVKGGNYELEMGTTLRELIYDIGGGIPDGRELRAVIPGGSSTPVLRADEIDMPLDAQSAAELGTMLGSGAVIAIDDRACLVQVTLRIAQFYMHESCGKCTPCREGTRWVVQIVRKIEEGRAEPRELDLLLDACDRILGKCLCPLGDADAMAVAGFVNKFPEEFKAHIEHGGCPYGGASSVEGIFAPVDQHSHHPTATVPS